MKQSDWISVKEKLPEIKEYSNKEILFSDCVLVYHGFFNNFNGITWYTYDKYGKNYSIKNVTHWMPLPEPPEVE